MDETERALRAIARQASLGWRCFFCDEVFTDKALAEEHFGSDEHEVSIPACIDPLRTDEKKRHREVHAMRQEIKRVEGERDEFEIDSDNLHAMQNELERLFGDGVTTAHHAWLRLEAAQNLAEAYREKLDTQPAAIASAEVRARMETQWKCRANPTSDPPQDCGWPSCGCDPHADKVIAALQESGHLPCDPNDNVSEAQFQKVIWDAIASVLGPKGQILANSLQEKLTIKIRDYLRWNSERAKAHREKNEQAS